MLNRVASVILCLIMFFTAQAPTFAQSTNSQSYVRPYSEQSAILQTALEPDFQATATDQATTMDQPGLWIASLLIPGLGQILMGEALRGVGFMLGVPLVAFLGLQLGIAATPGYELGSITFGMFLGLGLALGLHIWNIVDAYSLAQTKHATVVVKDNGMIGLKVAF